MNKPPPACPHCGILLPIHFLKAVCKEAREQFAKLGLGKPCATVFDCPMCSNAFALVFPNPDTFTIDEVVQDAPITNKIPNPSEN